MTSYRDKTGEYFVGDVTSKKLENEHLKKVAENFKKTNEIRPGTYLFTFFNNKPLYCCNHLVLLFFNSNFTIK